MLTILDQTDAWVVIQKPSGAAVHRSALAREGPFLERLLGDQLGRKVYPMHRLDRATSGALLFALSSEAARALQESLTSPDADKRYLALVRGHWSRGDDWQRIDRPLVDDHEVIRDASSLLRCVATSREPRCTLIEARPLTGRMHQIRRHLRGLDHPVLGDSKLGDTKANRLFREQHGLPRLALHCLSLDLPLAGGGRLKVRAPVPDDLLTMWTLLPWWPQVACWLEASTS